MCADRRTSPQALRRIRSATRSESSGSIGIQPVHRMTSAATIARNRAEQIAQHVQRGAMDVEVLAVAAAQDLEADEVDHEADQRDPEHQTAKDLDRREQAAHRLDRDPADDREQGQAVDERGQHLEAMIAVRAAPVARPWPTRNAAQASASAAVSVSMCPASAISASEPATMPPATSASMKAPVSAMAQEHAALIVRARVVMSVIVAAIDVPVSPRHRPS